MPSIETAIQTLLTAVITAFVTRVSRQLIGYRAESRAWRDEPMQKVDLINEATHATMRTELINGKPFQERWDWQFRTRDRLGT